MNSLQSHAPSRNNNAPSRVSSLAWMMLGLITASGSVTAAESSTEEDIRAIQAVGSGGAGFAEAIPAARRLQQLDSSETPRLLDAAEGANPISENWIRGVVFGIAKNSEPPAIELLQAYVRDLDKNPIGRGIAMELIRSQDPQVAKRMIDQCLNDPSLALREMAVDQAVKAAASFTKTNPDQAITSYRKALEAARHPKQLEGIVKALADLGDSVTTADAFSLITKWDAVAPFDNVGGVGFDQAYSPERDFASSSNLDLKAKYPGKSGDISWRAIEGSGDKGVVDLAEAFDKEKGAVAYLYTEFESPEARNAQARLGCINANKIWINGKEVMANEVYHSGSMLDQYVADCQLRQGTNRILLKICQNEQEESWAQNWQFQFRLTDPTGKGLTSGQ